MLLLKIGQEMKDFISNIIFIIFDILTIIISIYIAYLIRDNIYLLPIQNIALSTYINFYPLYIITIGLFAYEGIYKYRYDFWHESRVVFKTLIFSIIIIFAYLAMTKLIFDYSRFTIIMTLIIMMILIPINKIIIKKLLFRLKIWQKYIKIYGEDEFLTNEIYTNNYLGYIKAKNPNRAKTIFINSKNFDKINLEKIIDSNLEKQNKIIFIPFINDYDLSSCDIYQLSIKNTPLIVLKNNLKNRYKIILKKVLDIFIFIFMLPIITPIVLIIYYKIKKVEPNEKVFFKQQRLGKDNKIFICYKFRTMLENGENILNEYLSNNPQEVEYHNRYHKYKNDPRITTIGEFLRKTSLDELPQFLNILKGEMSFIGPRPYMLNEKDKIESNIDTILSVKPGITGLWQVSGRNDIDFKSRIELDLFYIRNWNIWMDLMIFIKTIKTVLFKDGAR